MRAILSASLALLPAGCIVLPVVPHTPAVSEHRGAPGAADCEQLLVGASTREDVLLQLGEPDLRTADDGAFGYVWSEAWLFWAIAGNTTGAAGELTSHLALMVAFDESGRLRRKELIVQPRISEDAAWLASLRRWR